MSIIANNMIIRYETGIIIELKYCEIWGLARN